MKSVDGKCLISSLDYLTRIMMSMINQLFSFLFELS
jgi:hypothetical protein